MSRPPIQAVSRALRSLLRAPIPRGRPVETSARQYMTEASSRSLKAPKISRESALAQPLARKYATRPFTEEEAGYFAEYGLASLKEGGVESSKRVEALLYIIAKGRFTIDINTKELCVENWQEFADCVTKEFDEDFLTKGLSFIKDSVKRHLIRIAREERIGADKVFLAKEPAQEAVDERIFSFYCEERSILAAKYMMKSSDGMTFEKDLQFIYDFLAHFSLQLIKNSVIEEAFKSLGFFDRHKRLEIDTSFSSFKSYARDSAVNIGGSFFCTNTDIFHLFETKEDQEQRGTGDFIKEMKRSLEKEGEKVSDLPFLLEGGNAVEDRRNGKIFICISDKHFDLKNSTFRYAPICTDDGNLSLVLDESLYCDLIRDWGKKNGFDIEILERNLDKYTIVQTYHLDTFMNIVGDKLLVHKDALTEDSYERLTANFAQENILDLNEKEWKKLATNFIALNENNVVLNGPYDSDLDRIIEFFNEKGVNCAVLAMHAGIFDEDGLRCRVSEGKYEKPKTSVICEEWQRESEEDGRIY